jgi:hypothetical protein
MTIPLANVNSGDTETVDTSAAFATEKVTVTEVPAARLARSKLAVAFIMFTSAVPLVPILTVPFTS